MIQKVTMPKLGQTMEKGVIEKWIKNEGDEVKKGDILLEITTDKATLEVESYAAGTLLKIVAHEGDEVPVNQLIAVVGDPGEEIPEELLKAPPPPPPAPEKVEAKAAAPAAAPSRAPALSPVAAPAATATAVAPAPEPVAAPKRLFVSPRARRLAQGELVPVKCLKGSGPGGRIVEADVKAYLEEVSSLKVTPAARALAFQKSVDIRAVTPSGARGRIMKEDVMAVADEIGEAVEPSAMRRVIAERLTQSKQQIPHFYLMLEIDMTDAVAWRKERNDRGGQKVSFNDMLMMACAKGFAEVPAMNRRWEGGMIIERRAVNIGLAVALDDGLIVPVIRHIERKNLDEVAAESARLVERARGKKLTPDEYEGGCLTISNLGMFGIDMFVPIINPGESAILGVGCIAERPVVRDGQIVARAVMHLTLAGDHRVLDGASAAGFLKVVREVLENPDELERSS